MGRVKNNSKLNADEQWACAFGQVWDSLVENHKNIGGFMILHEQRIVRLDANSMRLMGFESQPDYEAMLQQLEWLKGHSGSYAYVNFVTLRSDEEAEIGFISMEGRQEVRLVSSPVPVLAQHELVGLMDRNHGKELLMLVKLGGIETPSLLPCYIYSALCAIGECIGDKGLIGRRSESDFWIYFAETDKEPAEYAEELREGVRNCPLTDEFGFIMTERSGMDLCVGAAFMDDASPAKLMHAASYALFFTKSGGDFFRLMTDEDGQIEEAEFGKLNNFARLLDHNLFRYHFQPIVSAFTGEIVAYEALMRTDSDIGLNPLQILELADKFDRLYEIEYATVFNTMDQLSANQDIFENRKMFINIIPGHLLKPKDSELVLAKYGELLEKVVFEMTEQTEIPDERLAEILDRRREHGVQIAIDDYGTGYSNTSKLITVNPDYVKLDRSLISDVNLDQKKQTIIAGLIEFIHSYGGLVLGEGVETYEELATLIDLGCDLFQGYYISKPKPVLLTEISEKVRKEIEHINLETTSEIKKIYQAVPGEVTDMMSIAKQRITDVFIGDGEYILEGSGGQIAKNTIVVKEGAVCEIIIRNLQMQPESGRPSISIGEGSIVKLVVEGNCVFRKQGIYVPEGASLYIGGNGTLSIFAENRDCYGIGTSCRNVHGKIIIDISGGINIQTEGEYCVGIGGGKSSETIYISGGIINLSGSGSNCLGIGAVMDEAKVNITSCSVNVNYASARSCGIGSLDGSAEIRISNMSYESRTASRYFCGLGSLDGKKVNIIGSKLLVDIYMKGKRIVNIGSYGGECYCDLSYATINIYNEGEEAIGVGDSKGSGQVKITDVALNIKMLSGNAFAYGTKEKEAEIVRGSQNVEINA